MTAQSPGEVAAGRQCRRRLQRYTRRSTSSNNETEAANAGFWGEGEGSHPATREAAQVWILVISIPAFVIIYHLRVNNDVYQAYLRLLTIVNTHKAASPALVRSEVSPAVRARVVHSPNHRTVI